MIDIHRIHQAHKRIRAHIARTPLVPAFSMSHHARAVRLKLETTQPTGAFKLRGAINAVSQLSNAARTRGVVCVSTGNHGRALAWAANVLGAKATVCMSRLVPDNKRKAIEALGAEINIHGDSQDEAQTLVDRLVQNHGMTEIPPFDHIDVIAGQGTIGLELLEDWPEVDTIVVGLSGGGLLSGIALAAKTLNPKIRVIGVSPRRGAAMAASLDAGQPVEVQELATLADSLGGGIGRNNQYSFSLVQHLMDDLVLLDEDQIAEGMKQLYFNEQLVTEGAAAVGAALLISDEAQQQLTLPLGQHVALVISGRNIDMHRFTSLMASANHPANN